VNFHGAAPRAVDDDAGEVALLLFASYRVQAAVHFCS
jgi:hypothetical protein